MECCPTSVMVYHLIRSRPCRLHIILHHILVNARSTAPPDKEGTQNAPTVIRKCRAWAGPNAFPGKLRNANVPLSTITTVVNINAVSLTRHSSSGFFLEMVWCVLLADTSLLASRRVLSNLPNSSPNSNT